MRVILVLTVAVVCFLGCPNPPPQCAPKAATFDICDSEDNKLWRCPQATDKQLADRKAIEDGCAAKPDRTQCLIDAKFEMVATTLVADCGAGGQICRSSVADGGTSIAACQAK